MSIDIGIASQAGANSGGPSNWHNATQMGGGIPDFALTQFGTVVTKGTWRNSIYAGIGGIAGSNEACAQMRSSNQTIPTVTNRQHRSDKVVSCRNENAAPSGIVYEGDGTLEADGLDISFSTTTATARLINAWLVGGADVSNVDLRTFALNSGNHNALDKDIGFVPDVLLVWLCGDNNLNPSGGNTNVSILSFGAVHFDGASVDYGCNVFYSANATSTSNSAVYVGNDCAGGQIAASGVSYKLEFSKYEADPAFGYTIDPTADALGDYVTVAAIKFSNNPTIKITDWSMPTDGSALAVTGVGDTPKGGVGGYALVTSRNTYDNTDADCGGVYMYDGSDICCQAYYADDAETSGANFASQVNCVNGIVLGNEGGTNLALFDGTFTVNSGGWSLGRTTTPGSAYIGWDLAICDPAGQVVSLGQASESNTAFAMTPLKTAPLGQAQETDTGQALTSAKTRDIGQAQETDTAPAMQPVKQITLGQAAETDTGLAMAAAKALELGIALESDQAFVLGSAKTVSIGQAQELDTALAMTAGSGQTVVLGLATELDTALSLTAAKAKALGLATETDQAFVITVIGPTPPPSSEGLRYVGAVRRFTYTIP